MNLIAGKQKIIKIKNYYKNIQILNKISFFHIFKKIICLTLFLFIILISNNLYKNYIGNKIIITDKDKLILEKNWRKVNNEDLSFNIKFSIIVPVYNTEKWIEECLYSVLSQSIREIEIICVNDGSTDKSKEILQKIASIDNRIIIINQKNKGLPATRNAGLNFANGEYLLFLDSDDMFRNDTLIELMKIVNKEKVDIIYFDAFVFFMPGMIFDIKKVNYYKRNKSYGFMSGKDLFSNIIMNEQFSDSACLMMIDREWLIKNKIKFIEGIIYEDCIFSLQVMMKSNYTYHINEQFYIYRIRTNSIMNNKIKSINLYSRIIDYKELLKLYINNNFTMFQKKAFLKFINIIGKSIIYFNKIINKNEWELFCKKKPISINEKILLIMITKISEKINDLEFFWKLSISNNIEIYGIKDNRIIEFYKIINKTEIIKGYINSNLKYNISSINGKKVRSLNNDKNINKCETIIISVDEINIKREVYKLNSLGYKNIIIMNNNLNRILSKLINEITKQNFLIKKFNFFDFLFKK